MLPRCFAKRAFSSALHKKIRIQFRLQCSRAFGGWARGTYASPEANAANDSRLFRPNNVCGTRDIVTTECRRPDDVEA